MDTKHSAHRHDHGSAGAHQHGHGPVGASDAAFMTELLDLDAEVFHAYLSEAFTLVQQRSAGLPVHGILDLGCGTGTAALTLAQRFAGADVTAVDGSAEFLAHLRAKATGLGLAGRIHTVETDLDGPWPAIDPVDVAWTSMFLHHLADPDRGLAELFAAIRPGGLLAVAEIASPLRFLPDDIGVGRPGLEARCLAALGEIVTAELSCLYADWGPHLAGAGFTDMAERTFEIDLASPLPAPAVRYVHGSLRRTRAHLDGVLAADDLAALDAIIDGDGPGAVSRRQDLAIRGRRTLWTARHP
jgi:SAM-dependent methyltransferase